MAQDTIDLGSLDNEIVDLGDISKEPKKVTREQMLAEDEAKNPTPAWKKFMIGAGQGLTEDWRGLQQLYYKATGDEQKEKEITELGEQERELIKPLGGWATGGSVVGKAAPYSLIPGGTSGGALMRAGTSALSGGLAGGLGFSGQNENRLANIGLGAGAGAATSGLLSSGSKLINAPFTKTITNKWGIPTTISESLRGIPSRTDLSLEKIGFGLGTKAFREKQHEATKSAARRFLSQYIADPSAEDVYRGNRKFVSDLYEEMKGMLDQVPQEIKPQKTYEAAVSLLDEFPQVFEKLQNTKVKDEIMSIIKGTTPTKTVKVPPTKPNLGVTSASLGYEKTVQNTRKFDDLWELRRALGENLGYAKKELSQSNYRRYRELWSAVTEDLDNWASSINKPEIMSKFKEANKSYKDFVVKHNAVQQAYDDSFRATEGRYFSPQLFSNKLMSIIKKDKQYNTFSPSEIKEMSGLANIMQVVKRAEQKTPPGISWGTLTAGGLETFLYKTGGLKAAAVGAGAAGSAALIAKFLTTNPLGHKLVMSASKINPSSQEMKNLVNTVYRLAQNAAVQESKEVSREKPDLSQLTTEQLFQMLGQR